MRAHTDEHAGLLRYYTHTHTEEQAGLGLDHTSSYFLDGDVPRQSRGGGIRGEGGWRLVGVPVVMGVQLGVCLN